MRTHTALVMHAQRHPISSAFQHARQTVISDYLAFIWCNGSHFQKKDILYVACAARQNAVGAWIVALQPCQGQPPENLLVVPRFRQDFFDGAATAQLPDAVQVNIESVTNQVRRRGRGEPDAQLTAAVCVGLVNAKFRTLVQDRAQNIR